LLSSSQSADSTLPLSFLVLDTTIKAMQVRAVVQTVKQECIPMCRGTKAWLATIAAAYQVPFCAMEQYKDVVFSTAFQV
jgi:hypothetical protein